MNLLAGSKILILLNAAMFISASAHARVVTIQGKVSDSAGRAVTGAHTQFRVKIFTPDSVMNPCVLYSETQTLNLSDTNGNFTLNLNSASSTAVPPLNYTFAQAIANRGTFSISSSYCSSGAGTYSPAISDNRRLEISFKDETMSAFETIPQIDINPVPYSLEAEAVGGTPANAVLKVSDVNIANGLTTFAAQDFSDLKDLIAGSSAKYMGKTPNGGALIPSYSGAPSSLTDGSMWLDSSDGKIKYRTGGVTKFLDNSGATMTSVTAGAGLSSSGSATAITIDMPAQTSAGTYGAANQIPRIQVDNFGRVTAVTMVPVFSSGGTVTSVGVSVPPYMSATGGPITSSGTIALDFANQTAGTVFSAPNASTGAPSFRTLHVRDIKSTTDSDFISTAGACPAGQALGFNSVSDTLDCLPFVVSSSQITSALGFTPVNKAGDTLSGALNLPGDGLRVGVNQITTAGGNVGIGTNSPLVKLSVGGTIQIANGNETCASGNFVGALRYNAGAIDYCDGTSWKTLGIAGSGLTNFNGLTSSSQTLAYAIGGTAPSFFSASNTHTLQIPMASTAGTTAGLLSKSEYDAFNAKQNAGSYVTTLSGDITSSGYAAGTVTTTIANGAVTDAKISGMGIEKLLSAAGKYFTYQPNGTACASGQVLKWDGATSSWLCGVDNGLTSEADPTVQAFAKAAPSADFSTPGNVLTLNSVGVAKGGTGLNALGTANQILGVKGDASGLEYKNVSAGSGVTISNGAGALTISATGSGGTVTSVGLAVPSFMTTAGGPITSAGNITLGYGSQTAGYVLASPLSSTGAPTFRRLQKTDLASSFGGNFFNVSADCPAGQALQYELATDTVLCKPVVLSSSQITAGLGFTPVNKAGDTMSGALNLPANGLAVGTSQLTVAAGKVGVGTASAGADLDVNGQAILVRGAGSSGGEMRFGANPAAGSNYVGFRGPSANPASNVIWQLPAADGGSGQVLSTNGAGVLSWNTPSAGTITSVTASAPVVSSGGSTPVISMAAANTSANGYLTSTDWNTFNNKAPTASPIFTGVPLAPTAAANTNTQQLATTAFVVGQAGTANPVVNGTAAVGTSLRYAREDHVHPTDSSRAPAAGSSSITTLGTITSGTWNGSTLTVPYGGTGLTTGAVGSIPYFATTSTMATTAAGTSGQVLTLNGSGIPTWAAAATGSVTGTGTVNYLSKFSSSTGIASSIVYDNGASVGIGTSSPSALLTVGNQLTGAAASNTFTTNAGALGGTAGSGLNLGSLGGLAGTNAISLGVKAARLTNGTDWTTSAIRIGMDVDAAGYPSASPGYIEFNATGVAFPKGLVAYNGTTYDSAVGIAKYNAFTGNAAAGSHATVATFGMNGAAGANFNTIGAYINNSSTVSGTGVNYGLYSIGNSNYFSGNVGIGSLTPAAKLDVAGAILASPQGTGAGQGGEIRFGELSANGTDYVGFRAPDAIATSKIWTLPATDGSAGQVLKTDGAGVLSWAASTTGAVTSITGTAPVTVTGTSTPVISMAAATTSVNGYLTSTDWTTFNNKAPINSPTFTGIPAGPTAAVNTNSTQLATTQFVLGQASSSTPVMDGTATAGALTTYARGDHVHPTDTSRAPAAGSSSITTLGTITSGTWNGSPIGVGFGGTGLTAGTSGGIPYYSASNSMASSGALAQNQLVMGGGVGGAPTTVTAPSASGQILVSTGTTSAPTWQNAPTNITSSGSAGYHAKFNGSGTALSSGAIYDTGSAIGVNNTSPQAALDVSGRIRSNDYVETANGITGNAYYTSGWNYRQNGYSFLLNLRSDASYAFLEGAASGTAGSAMTRTTAMAWTYDGKVGVGTTAPNSLLTVDGGGGNFSLKPGTTNDHVYMQLFARSAASTTRSGYFGYGGAGTSTMTLANEIANGITQFTTNNGHINLLPGSGNVGVGTTAPGAKLHVFGGSIMPTVGNSAVAGIQFPSDPGGGSGDSAWIRYFVKAGESTDFQIGTDNDADDEISFWQMGAKRMNIYNGNVGIGTNAPTSPLEVNGAIKSTVNNASRTSMVRVYLNTCGGGPCASNHTLNQWYNIGANYVLNISNEDGAVYTTTNNGVVTINQSGSYMIKITTMSHPAADRGVDYACPFINGSVNCLAGTTGDQATHTWSPANNWATVQHIFIATLGAGTTVSYGYYPVQTMNYWSHDNYTGMSITRIN